MGRLLSIQVSSDFAHNHLALVLLSNCIICSQVAFLHTHHITMMADHGTWSYQIPTLISE